MESFTLLKYWRTRGATGGGATTKAALNPADYGFDGPYFDLEFTLTDETSETTETESGSYAEDLSENESDKDGELVLSQKLGKSNSSNGLLQESGRSEKIDERENQRDIGEEVKGPLVSLFAIDKANHQSDDRNLPKEVLQKYLNVLKPLYVGVSTRYVEKMKFPAGQGGGAVTPPSEKGRSSVKTTHNNLQAGLKVMRKHLGKSRSTSAVSPPPGNRRDDSMLAVQDGIEGAILHCKRSFNSDREGEFAKFSRSVSDPS